VIFAKGTLIDANNGTIIAGGTPQKPVNFRPSKPGNDSSTAAGKIIIGEGAFTYVNFVNLASIEGIPYDESENTFTSCSFTNNVNAGQNFLNVNYEACVFNGNQFSITTSKIVSVSGTTFKNSQVCLQGAAIKVKLSSFTGCDIAVNSDGSEVPLMMDQVVINGGKTALIVNEKKDATVTNSNFIGSTRLSTGHFQGKISGNYWGSATITDILPKISWDVGSDAVKALISPIATAPITIQIPNNKK